MEKSLITILIPFHHEGTTLITSLDKLIKTVPNNYAILLIHDDTNDPTLNLLTPFTCNYPQIKVLLNTKQRGAAGALLTGIEHSPHNWVLFFVADDLQAIDSIPLLVSTMTDETALINTSRYRTKQAKPHWPFTLSGLVNRLTSCLIHQPITDYTCGIKLINRRYFNNFASHAIGWEMAMEMLLFALNNQLTIKEVSIKTANRTDGTASRFNTFTRCIDYLKILMRLKRNNA